MSTAVARIEPSATAAVARPVQMLRPIAPPKDVLAAQEATRDLVSTALVEGRDYGRIKGTDRNTMLKSGSERVALAFGCYYGDAEIVEQEIDHDREIKWSRQGKPMVSYGLYRYVVRVPVINRATGETVGSGMGACSTMESKYVSRPRDCENTVLKMAYKRAIVAACLTTFGLSDQFTQDVEDATGSDDAPAAEAAPHADAQSEPEPEVEITRETPITWGRQAGTPIKDLHDKVLEWAIQPDRKFGPDTPRWQAAMRAELQLRLKERETEAANKAKIEPVASAAAPAATEPATAPATVPAKGDDDELPF